MKKLYTLFIALFFLTSVFAQKNTALINNGSWSDVTTWSLNHTPADGETVDIPSGMAVLVADNINLSNSHINIEIAGSLDFGNGKLYLGQSSKITVLENATIKSIKGSNNNKISIGNVEKYNGSQGTLTGVLVASSTTGVAPNGFMATEPVVLPVKFASFNLTALNGQVLVKWSTAEEVDAAYFEVQRSSNGATWTGIGRVKATGTSRVLAQYSFTDCNSLAGTVYYRIQQADHNGKVMYTPVQAISTTVFKPVHIFTAHQKVAVQFAQPVKEKTEVVIINRAGQVMARQLVQNGASQVVLNSAGNLKGAYFVTVTISANINTTQQIIL